MQILFAVGYSNSLLEAIRLVLNIDPKSNHFVLRYDASVSEDVLIEPILFLFDESKKGVDLTTRRYAEELGYRVFAYKLKRGQKRKFFEDALTVLSLLPKALDLIQTKRAPFLYTFRYKSNKFANIRLDIPQQGQEKPKRKKRQGSAEKQPHIKQVGTAI